MSDTERAAIIAALQRFLALIEAAPHAPCPVCAELMPASYHYCDQCGAQLPGGAA